MKIIFVDFDGTLIAPKAQGEPGIIFNEELAAKLLQAQREGALVIGFTSYLLAFNLAQNLKFGSTRIEVLRKCEAMGLTLDAVITTASPYAEVIKGLGFGAYYNTAIKPIEEEALAAEETHRPEIVSRYADTESPFLTENEEVGEIRTHYRIFGQDDPEAFKKGKEEMFRYAIGYFQNLYHGVALEFEIHDDNGKVIEVAGRLKEEEHVNITGYKVMFQDIPTTLSDSPHSAFAPPPASSSGAGEGNSKGCHCCVVL